MPDTAQTPHMSDFIESSQNSHEVLVQDEETEAQKG